MLRIEGLKVSFGSERILRGIDLEVADGECIAIIGESGAGKTTLGLSIMGLLNGNARGQINLGDTDLLSLSEEEIRRLRWNRVAMAFPERAEPAESHPPNPRSSGRTADRSRSKRESAGQRKGRGVTGGSRACAAEVLPLSA